MWCKWPLTPIPQQKLRAEGDLLSRSDHKGKLSYPRWASLGLCSEQQRLSRTVCRRRLPLQEDTRFPVIVVRVCPHHSRARHLTKLHPRPARATSHPRCSALWLLPHALSLSFSVPIQFLPRKFSLSANRDQGLKRCRGGCLAHPAHPQKLGYTQTGT